MTISIKGGNSATTTGKILDRPYVGLWKPNFRKVLSYSPDALVYINGDTSLVGCKDCNNRIDFQPYITSVSAGAGVESSSGDATISFSIPKHHGDSIFKDGAFLITPGLEVNVYLRGVFDVRDLNPEEVIKYEDGESYNLKDLKMKPYYPVFHGVVTTISYAYSGGFYNGSFSCNNLLYFWQYQFIDTNTAAMAARPGESAGQVQMLGHKYTGMTPHQIIYDLFRDSGGSAQGVVAGINKKTNVNARVGKQDAFSLSLRYWEQRFSQGMYGLRMHGTSGRLLSSLEQVFYGRLGSGNANKVVAETLGVAHKQQSKTKTPNPVEGLARKVGAVKINEKGRIRIVERNFDIKEVEATSEKGKGTTTADMQAYVLDIGNLASINLWESSYESKMDIASTVSQKANFEFYQDVDGDLVFKPPLYNLNTKASRVYVLKPEDIISMNFSVKEPQYTYAVVKGVLFKNLNGVIDDEFLTPKSTYIDYRLVAKYGWRPLTIDSNIITNTTAAFYYAAAELDRQNQDAETASVSITLRPEIKPGYPVYIEHIDCFYYVTSVSHDFSYGSSCSTTIEIKARRKRFMPPGDINVSYKDDPSRAVDLINTNKGAKFLKKKETPVATSGIESEEVVKVTGFPNVVMGLDMTRIDPNFFFMGTETLEIDKPHFKNMLIVEAMNLGVLKLDPDNGNTDVFDDNAKFVVYNPIDNSAPQQIGTIKGSDISKGQQQISQINENYQTSKQKAANNKKLNTTQQADAQAQAEQELKKGYNDLTSVDNNIQGKDVSFIYDEQLEASLLTAQQEVLSLLDLINIIRINKVRANEVSTGMGSTANILELLSNKKNAFSPHVPGYFRYYSCSHPDPKMQGASEIKFNTNSDGDPVSVGEVLIETGQERFNGNKINMILPDPTSDDGDLVKLVEAYPKAGLKVKNPFTKELAVIATNEITSLTFQEHEVKVRTVQVGKKKKEEILIDVPKELINTNTREIQKQVFDIVAIQTSTQNVKTTDPKELVSFVFPDIQAVLDDLSIPDTVKDLVKDPNKLFAPNTVVQDSTNSPSSIGDIVASKAVAIAYQEFNKGLAFEWTQQAKYAWMKDRGGANAVNNPEYNILNAGNVYIDANYFEAIFRDFKVNKSWEELDAWLKGAPLNNEWCGSLPAFCYKDLVKDPSLIKKNFPSTLRLYFASGPTKTGTEFLYRMEWLQGKNLSGESIKKGDIIVVWDNNVSKERGNHITLCIEPPSDNYFWTIEGNRDATPGGEYPSVKGTDNSLKSLSQGVLKHKRNISDIRFVYRIREEFLIPPVENVPQGAQNQTQATDTKTLFEYAAGNIWNALQNSIQTLITAPSSIDDKTTDQVNKSKEEVKKVEAVKKAIDSKAKAPKVTAKKAVGSATPKTKKSMVFPVSDEEGYEVYGFQAYGRGLDLKVNGGYMSLIEQDYTRLLDSDQIESIYKLIKDGGGKDDIKKELQGLGETLSNMSPEEREVIYNTAGIDIPQYQDGDAQAKMDAFLSGFANRIVSSSDTEKYDTNRLVVAENVPKALNQIAPRGIKNSGSVCQCRGYDSDLDLENLTDYNTPFVKLDFSGSEPDTFSQKLHDVMIQKGLDWKVDQESYRGADSIVEGANLRNYKDVIATTFENARNNVLGAPERLETLTENYSKSLESIDKKEKEEIIKANK